MSINQPLNLPFPFVISPPSLSLQTRTPWEEQQLLKCSISYCRWLPWPLCETNHLCRRCSLLLLHWTSLNVFKLLEWSGLPTHAQSTRMSVSIAYGLWLMRNASQIGSGGNVIITVPAFRMNLSETLSTPPQHTPPVEWVALWFAYTLEQSSSSRWTSP